MGIAKKVYTCDCCGKIVADNEYFHQDFYKARFYHWRRYNIDITSNTAIICKECMIEIGRCIEKKHKQQEVNFEVI